MATPIRPSVGTSPSSPEESDKLESHPEFLKYLERSVAAQEKIARSSAEQSAIANLARKEVWRIAIVSLIVSSLIAGSGILYSILHDRYRDATEVDRQKKQRIETSCRLDSDRSNRAITCSTRVIEK